LLARADESEFVVVVDAAPAEAMAMALRLSAEIKKIPFRVAQSSLKITVSMGVAGFPDHSGLAQQIYEYAETAMAAAQAKGRNVCLMYQPSMRPRDTVHRPMDAF
jgi:diguanylate cyclase (GGDEF)-like protein